MAKIIADVVIKIVITYGSIIGTLIVIAGIVHLFCAKDGGTSIGIVTVGATLVFGRSLTEVIGSGMRSFPRQEVGRYQSDEDCGTDERTIA